MAMPCQTRRASSGGFAHVAAWSRDGQQAVFVGPGESPARQSGRAALRLSQSCHGRFLQLFVGTLHAAAAHHAVWMAWPALPAAVSRSARRGFFVQLQLCPGLHRQRVVGQPPAHRPPMLQQHGGISQVALPAADGQLFRSGWRSGALASFPFAFGVFKVDGPNSCAARWLSIFRLQARCFEIAQVTHSPTHRG